MTSINSISSQSNIQQLSPGSQRGLPPPPPSADDQQGKDGGGLLGAIDAALKSAGIEGGLQAIFGPSSATSAASETNTTADSSATDASTSTDPTSALNAFLQQLMSALQAQGTTDSDSAENGPAEDNAFAMQGMPPPPPPHGYGGQGMADKLQSLISSLTGSDGTGADSTSDNSLENSFQSLVGALGGTTDSHSLSNFLQSLATSMQHHGASGNVVSTTA